MKQAKRILSLLLSLCLVLGLIPGTAYAAGGNLPFTDVNTTDWFYDAVQYAYEKGMMSGTSTTTFSPGSTTTRGMIVTILHRMEGTPAANGTDFTDVPGGQWYSNAVSWASANGIVSGYGNGLFGPSDPITREQMAAILNRYSTYKGYDAGTVGSITGFSDASQVSAYAVEPMGWAIGNGLISGVGNNTLAPKGNATRAQAATILMRFCKNIADKTTGTVGKTYTVTFDLNYGSDTQYDAKTVKEGETVVKPSNPSRSGYSFNGWYAEKSGGRQFDFKKCITSDITLYAHWSSNSSSNGGNSGGGGGYIPPISNPSKEITYKAPTENDIDFGMIEYDGQTYSAQYVNNQMVVVFKDGTASDRIESFVESYGASIVGKIETIGTYQIEFSSAKTMDELNAILTETKKNTSVEDAYLNTVVECEDTIVPYYPTDTWDIPAGADPRWDELYPQGNNWGAEAINAPSAWQLLMNKYGTISQIPRVHVGVIDTYIDVTHDDLAVNAVYWYQSGFNVFKKNQTDTTAAEYAAAADSWGKYTSVIHGTHVMGTIGATMNNGGINGIALNPELYGVSIAEADSKIVYTRFGLSTALSNLIEDSKCKVINFSMGYSKYNPKKAQDDAKKVENVLQKYLNKHYDFVIIAAAGNDKSRDAQYNTFFSAISDTTVKSHIVIVGNAKSDYDGTVSLYENQNYGLRVDVIAPGTDIYSTVSPNKRSFSDDKYTRFDYKANSRHTCLTGTSMAAPHVSGVAALVWAANPALTGDRVKDVLVQTANIPVDGKDAGGYSHHMINAAYAVSKALGINYTISGTCGNNTTWTLDSTGNITIQGTGEMTWDSTYAPWYRYCEVITSVNVESGITSICEEAFFNCNKVTAVELGNTVKSIGSYAFGEMPNLHSVEIPSTVQEIGDHAFGYYEDTPINKFTIYGYSGTTAETYAQDNGFAFIDLTSDPDPSPTISGTVIDSNTEMTIEGVNVYLNCVFDAGGADIGATSVTATDGTFQLKIPENATDVTGIRFEKEGYDRYLFPLVTSVNSSVDIGVVKLVQSTTSTEGPFAGGDGTEKNPYQIATPEQLAYLSEQAYDGEVFAGQYFELIANIDLSQYTSWTPIGSNHSNRFQGNFDGNGYRISNMSIIERSGMYFGLFGYLHNATIKDVVLDNVNISLNGGVQVVGGITGGAYESSISNCTISGKISVVSNAPISGLDCGGIIGIINGTSNITNCSNSANIDCGSSTNVGGIVGSAWATMNSTIQIIGCTNHGKIVGGENTGDIAGSYGAYPGSSIIIE